MSAFIYPNIGTMPSRALSMLLQGKRITHRDFWLHVGSYRLSAPIFQLRDKGWTILDSQEVVVTSDPTKRNAHIKRYYISQEILRSIGESGRDYVRRVQDWERMQMTGKAVTNPADKADGIHRQETDNSENSIGGVI